jgi:mRNA interferase YafQ
MLATGPLLPPKYRDHSLVISKEYKNVRECHIEPDWLLVYRIENDELTLYLIRTGSHSDLF